MRHALFQYRGGITKAIYKKGEKNTDLYLSDMLSLSFLLHVVACTDVASCTTTVIAADKKLYVHAENSLAFVLNLQASHTIRL